MDTLHITHNTLQKKKMRVKAISGRAYLLAFLFVAVCLYFIRIKLSEEPEYDGPSPEEMLAPYVNQTIVFPNSRYTKRVVSNSVVIIEDTTLPDIPRVPDTTQCHALEKKWTWCSDEIPTLEEGNALIKNLIKHHCQFTMARPGGTEVIVVREAKQTQEMYDRLWRESGVFPATEEVYKVFAQETLTAIKEATIITDLYPLEWQANMTRELVEKYNCDASRVRWYSLVSFWGGDSRRQELGHDGLPDPWMHQLAGKKVLIVSTFILTGPEQYMRADSRFPRVKKLVWLRPPQAYAYNKPYGYENKTWVDALNDMKDMMTRLKDEYDIALLSCGAFGPPLNNHLKTLGRSSIYIGGSLQAMFGVRGFRWKPYIEARSSMYPEDAKWWVYSHPAERPRQCRIVEECPYM